LEGNAHEFARQVGEEEHQSQDNDQYEQAPQDIFPNNGPEDVPKGLAGMSQWVEGGVRSAVG